MRSWAISKLKLKSELPYRTIVRILGNEEDVKDWMKSDSFRRKKRWSVRNWTLGEQLNRWVAQMCERGNFVVPGDCDQGSVIANYSESSAPPHEQTNFSFSNWCLDCFKKRDKFKRHKIHGEDG